MENKISTDNIQLMSLGSMCAALDILPADRIRGPVDNVIITLNDLRFLFDGSIYAEILYDKPDIQTFSPHTANVSKTYTYRHIKILHNDPTTEKFKAEFKKRLDNLKTFYKKVLKDDNYYFIYVLGTNETDNGTGIVNENVEDQLITLRQLGILDKTIFVGTRKINNGNYYDFHWDKLPNIPSIKYIEVNDISLDPVDGSHYNEFINKLRLFNNCNQLSVVLTDTSNIDIKKQLTNQIFTNFECIIPIDENDTENKWLKEENFRFKIVSTKSHDTALDTALGSVKNDYVIFLDSRDKINENFLLYIYDRIETNPQLKFISSSKSMNTISGKCFNVPNIRKFGIKFPTVDDYKKLLDKSYTSKYAYNSTQAFMQHYCFLTKESERFVNDLLSIAYLAPVSEDKNMSKFCQEYIIRAFRSVKREHREATIYGNYLFNNIKNADLKFDFSIPLSIVINASGKDPNKIQNVIDKIKAQTFSNFECTILTDIKIRYKIDYRFRVFTTNNPYEDAFNYTRGKYISFLDENCDFDIDFYDDNIYNLRIQNKQYIVTDLKKFKRNICKFIFERKFIKSDNPYYKDIKEILM